MDSAGKYILSVGVAALMGGILTDLTDSKSSTGILTRMVCGLFLAIVVIKPFGNLNFDYLADFADTFSASAQSATATGAEVADKACREIIKSETEAYILDKASSYDLQVEVQVTLSDGDEALPESVHLSGAASPYARARLQEIISDELGIPKERQLWIG